MFGIGKACGKFGELLQGELPGIEAHFLISLPILNFSIAEFHCSEFEKEISVYPAHKTKSASITKKIMAYFGLTYGWRLKITSQIAEGKGLGSSTADLIASARAITKAIGKDLPLEVLLAFLKEIEPSDGIMYDGIVCFYHRKVALHTQLESLPDLVIAALDEGGTIDTIKYNQELKPYTTSEKSDYTVLLKEMLNAIKQSDLKKIGALATKSAVLHQKLNPKKNLNYFIEMSNKIDALGVVVAHSGTYIGIMLDKSCDDYHAQMAYIEKQMQVHSLLMEKFTSFGRDNEPLCVSKSNTEVKDV